MSYKKPDGLKTYRAYLPRRATSTHEALYESSWRLTWSRKGYELLQNFHAASFSPFSLELFAHNQTISIGFAASGASADSLGALLHTTYPEAQIKEIPDPLDSISEDAIIGVGNITYTTGDHYPSEDFVPIQCDPMKPILHAIGQVPAEYKILTQISLKVLKTSVRLHAYLWLLRMKDRILHIFRIKYWFKSKEIRKLQIEKMIEKTTYKWFRCNLRIAVAVENVSPGQSDKMIKKDIRKNIEQIFTGFALQNHPDLNAYKVDSVSFSKREFEKLRSRHVGFFRPTIRNTDKELAGWWHMPTIEGPNLSQVLARDLSPPELLLDDENDPGISMVGETVFRGQNMKFGIHREDRNRHLFLVGTAGAGKSRLIQLLMQNDIEQGYGCGLVDPNGDLVDDILKIIPPSRIKDVIIFDPADVEFPASLNPFELVDDKTRMRVGYGLLEMFHQQFKEKWTDRLEHLLLNAILALLSTQWTTILSMKRLLTDAEYRASVVPAIADEVVKEFWENEYPMWIEAHQETVIAPLVRMINDFIGSEMLRNCLGQPFNKFEFRDIIDSNKILLVKVSKRLLGDDSALLLGSMILTRIYQAAMSRVDVDFEQRPDFYLYVDQFEEFATSSFEEILSESRKYRLNLTVTAQNLNLLPSPVKNTIFGNIGSIVSFRTSAEDAPALVREFQNLVTANDLTNLPPRYFYIRTPVQSVTQKPFSARTIDLSYPEEEYVERCIEHSRENYSLPREHALELIQTWGKVG